MQFECRTSNAPKVDGVANIMEFRTVDGVADRQWWQTRSNLTHVSAPSSGAAHHACEQQHPRPVSTASTNGHLSNFLAPLP